ncbi:DUF3644 domain-containing protein [Bradyrhizobium sp. 188]|uniref:DUF3644 domain-containing protein n=1 Tax=Bradyrhizobium sp. 188 TaxID=2782656 RepID=UPI001FF7EB2D|nr:DUF3644 domain-containing protein [Bradyrhizobium sp. 188]MCK1501069.1 DUF3644 domain-containing protein [Bradyrhizobium sp. 188]
MAARKRGNKLEKWEIALIKAMLARAGSSDQDILAYFTRPTRSINHRAIAEIRTESKHKSTKAAAEADLEDFLATWPEVDPQTGLSLRGDELLIKAREAMVAAVHVFNGAGLTFRAELFIVTSVIAWTYLLHAWFRREGIDYRYVESDGTIKKTKEGEDCYWDLGKCLRHARCPIPKGAITNLEFLLALRHEIEHRSTNRIDDAISAKLQACCINFNDSIKKLFGAQFGLERRLPIALQFVTFSADQRSILKKASNLPQHIATMMDAFHQRLTEEQQADSQFAYRVAFIPKTGNRASNADLAIEFVKADSAEGREINSVLLKEVDKRRFTATQIIRTIRDEGFPNFTQHHHTTLWQELDARNPTKGFGRPGDYPNTWVWYESWLARVRAHCQEHADRYAPLNRPTER